MKKKVLSVLLSAAMAASILAGCGQAAAPAAPAADSGSDAAEAEAEAPAAEAEAPAAEAEAPAAGGEGGKVLNIAAWNEEFKTRLTDHYPGYEVVDGTHGKIGDVTVNWLITPNENNAYQDRLDEILLGQESAAQDDKLDLFLVEADYALKYVDTEYAASVEGLGISLDETKDQYQYTKDIMTDSNGVLKGVSWQGCPGVMIYQRAIAKDVFGTDDPEEIQKLFADWDKFNESADKLKEKGYLTTASVADTWRVYQNNVTKPFVDGTTIQIDDNIKKWAEDSKDLYDRGCTTTANQWTDDWSKGFYPDGKVFCYFGPAWLIDFSMAADTEGSVAHDGGWAATEGPQGFFWGGTWICGCEGTDNADLVADIMRKMTMDPAIMKDIVLADNDFVNNRPVMEELANDPSYQNKVLGGQNPLKMFCAGADKIDMSNLTAYDQGLLGDYQTSMVDWMNGNFSSYDEALEDFYKAAEVRYPELSH